jgi:uncharacterized protein (DUF1778 family)
MGHSKRTLISQLTRVHNAPSVTIGARIDAESFAIIDAAARIRGCTRAKIIEVATLEYAKVIIAEAGGNIAALSQMTRQSKARQGGLAVARKRKR